jgi:hypothetical protein
LLTHPGRSMPTSYRSLQKPFFITIFPSLDLF